MANDVGIRVGVDGEKQFKDSIKGINSQLKNLSTEMDASTKEFDKNADSQQALKSKMDILGRSVDAGKQKVELLSKQYDTQNNKLADLGKELDRVTDEFGANSKEAEKAQTAYNRQATQVNNLGSQLNTAKSDLNQFETQMKEAKEQSDKLTSGLKNTAEGLDKFSQKTSKIGNALTLGVTTPLLAMGAGAVSAFNDVDDGADIVIQKTGAMGKAAKELESVYKDVAGTVSASSFSMDQIGAAVGEINTRLDFTGDALKKASEDFLKFARLNGMDVETAVQKVSRAMGDAGIAAEEYADVLDALNVAGQKSGISIELLAENMTKYGAPMRALGYDTKESIAIFSAWEKAGVNTEIAFSGMKKAISNFMSSGKDAKVEFKKLVSGVQDGSVSAQEALEIFGAKAGPDLVDAIQEGRFSFEDMLEAVKNSKGSLSGTFDSVIDEADEAKAAYNRVKIQLASVGETLLVKAAPAVEKLAGTVTDLLDSFNNLDDGTKDLIVNLALGAAATGPLIKGISGITNVGSKAFSGLSKLSSKIGGLGKAASNATPLVSGLSTSSGKLATVLLNPLAIAAGGVAISIAGITKAMYDASEPTRKLSEAIGNAAPDLKAYEDYIAGATGALSDFNIESTQAGEKIKSYDEGISNAISNIHAITETAASQSREFTQAEYNEIQRLIGMIDDYTNKKIEAYQQQQDVVRSMAELESNMTKERSAELIKSAEDTKNQTVEIANAKYQALLSEAETMYQAGQIEKDVYDQMRRDAKSAFDSQESSAETAMAKTLSIISDQYYKQNIANNENLNKWKGYMDAYNLAMSNHNSRVEFYRQQMREGWISYEMFEAQVADSLERIETDQVEAKRELVKAGAQYFDEGVQDNLSYWTTMLTQTAYYGGAVTDEQEKFLLDLSNVYETLPDDLRETGREAMEGFNEGMKGKEAQLIKEAASIGSNIINTLNKMFDIHSPSRVMREMAGYFWGGWELESNKSKKKLVNQVSGISKDINLTLHSSLDNLTVVSSKADYNSSNGFSIADAIESKINANINPARQEVVVSMPSGNTSPSINQTNNFYSPEALSPAETARLNRNNVRNTLKMMR